MTCVLGCQCTQVNNAQHYCLQIHFNDRCSLGGGGWWGWEGACLLCACFYDTWYVSINMINMLFMYTQDVFTLCFHVMFSCYVFMLCFHVMFSCYVFMLCFHVMFLCYIFMLCFYVMFSCYVFMLCFYVMFSCYVFMLCFHVRFLCYVFMLCFHVMFSTIF